MHGKHAEAAEAPAARVHHAQACGEGVHHTRRHARRTTNKATTQGLIWRAMRWHAPSRTAIPDLAPKGGPSGLEVGISCRLARLKAQSLCHPPHLPVCVPERIRVWPRTQGGDKHARTNAHKEDVQPNPSLQNTHARTKISAVKCRWAGHCTHQSRCCRSRECTARIRKRFERLRRNSACHARAMHSNHASR
jgi:hypothetical protein